MGVHHELRAVLELQGEDVAGQIGLHALQVPEGVIELAQRLAGASPEILLIHRAPAFPAPRRRGGMSPTPEASSLRGRGRTRGRGRSSPAPASSSCRTSRAPRSGPARRAGPCRLLRLAGAAARTDPAVTSPSVPARRTRRGNRRPIPPCCPPSPPPD